MIAHETGVVSTIDPLGGSYYLEHLTDELERQAYDYFRRIDELGGVVAAIEQNFFQREIAEASFRYQSEVEAEQRVIVGVNRYQPGRRGDPDPQDRPGPRAHADRPRPGACGRAATRPLSRRGSPRCAKPPRATTST